MRTYVKFIRFDGVSGVIASSFFVFFFGTIFFPSNLKLLLAFFVFLPSAFLVGTLSAFAVEKLGIKTPGVANLIGLLVAPIVILLSVAFAAKISVFANISSTLLNGVLLVLLSIATVSFLVVGTIYLALKALQKLFHYVCRSRF